MTNFRFFAKMQNSGGVRKFFSVFSWGTKIFCLNFMGYEIFFGILEFHSAPVPGIKTDRSLIWRSRFPFLLIHKPTHTFTTYDDISQTYLKHKINIHITYEKHIFLCSLIMFIICTHMFIICTRYLQTIICRRPNYIWVHMTYIW